MIKRHRISWREIIRGHVKLKRLFLSLVGHVDPHEKVTIGKGIFNYEKAKKPKAYNYSSVY
jgi:hypothetical protein